MDWINHWPNEWLIEESSIDCWNIIVFLWITVMSFYTEWQLTLLADHNELFIFHLLVRYTCRGLFERHKLLFSFQMCSKILEAAGKLNMDEYNFFLRGGVVSSIDSPFPLWFAFHFNSCSRTVVFHFGSLRLIQRQKIFSLPSTSRYFTSLFSTTLY